MCATFLFLPHFDVICDLLLIPRTATRNLFVKLSLRRKNIKTNKNKKFAIARVPGNRCSLSPYLAYIYNDDSLEF